MAFIVPKKLSYKKTAQLASRSQDNSRHPGTHPKEEVEEANLPGWVAAGDSGLLLPWSWPFVSVFLFHDLPHHLNSSSISKSLKEAHMCCLPYQGQGFRVQEGGHCKQEC